MGSKPNFSCLEQVHSNIIPYIRLSHLNLHLMYGWFSTHCGHVEINLAWAWAWTSGPSIVCVQPIPAHGMVDPWYTPVHRHKYSKIISTCSTSYINITILNTHTALSTEENLCYYIQSNVCHVVMIALNTIYRHVTIMIIWSGWQPWHQLHIWIHNLEQCVSSSESLMALITFLVLKTNGCDSKSYYHDISDSSGQSLPCGINFICACIHHT